MKFTYLSCTSHTHRLKVILCHIFNNFVHETKRGDTEASESITVALLRRFLISDVQAPKAQFKEHMLYSGATTTCGLFRRILRQVANGCSAGFTVGNRGQVTLLESDRHSRSSVSGSKVWLLAQQILVNSPSRVCYIQISPSTITRVSNLSSACTIIYFIVFFK